MMASVMHFLRRKLYTWRALWRKRSTDPYELMNDVNPGLEAGE